MLPIIINQSLLNSGLEMHPFSSTFLLSTYCAFCFAFIFFITEELLAQYIAKKYSTWRQLKSTPGDWLSLNILRSPAFLVSKKIRKQPKQNESESHIC
jgi:hypothetical protein